MQKSKNKDNSKPADEDAQQVAPLPSNPVLVKISRFDTRQTKQGISNYTREMHGKKNRVFRGVR